MQHTVNSDLPPVGYKLIQRTRNDGAQETYLVRRSWFSSDDEETSSGGGGLFWAAIIIFVLFMLFSKAEPAPKQAHIQAQSVEYKH